MTNLVSFQSNSFIQRRRKKNIKAKKIVSIITMWRKGWELTDFSLENKQKKSVWKTQLCVKIEISFISKKVIIYNLYFLQSYAMWRRPVFSHWSKLVLLIKIFCSPWKVKSRESFFSLQSCCWFASGWTTEWQRRKMGSFANNVLVVLVIMFASGKKEIWLINNGSHVNLKLS